MTSRAVREHFGPIRSETHNWGGDVAHDRHRVRDPGRQDTSGLDTSFLHLETGPAHMHVASTTLFEGPTPELRGVPRPHRLAAPPGAALPPEAPLRPLRPGPAGLGRRPPPQPRLPRPPHRPPSPGQRGAAANARRADLLAAARPHEAAVGDVAGRRRRGRSLRDRRQDPPLPRRRRLRGRHDHGPLRPRARARARAPSPEPWLPEPRAQRTLSSSARRWSSAPPARARSCGALARCCGRRGRSPARRSRASAAAGAIAAHRPRRPRLPVQRRDRAVPALRLGASGPRPS